ncbi:MAG TPA: 2-phospho-L-lactate guanylyltransferase [Mycobacteriales bacterium]|nr:2-phospho-L-lactate guanylyltransferase [Mycobacteriales bacterium]
MKRSEARWAIVVPVKRLAVAKTRLSGVADVRADLALAMALDTVAAARGCAVVDRVVVVTDEPSAAQAVTAMGALVVADAPDAGLNPALRHGALAAARSAGDMAIAALSSDLPALRPADLDAVLRAASAHSCCVVADADGTGTTLLTAQDVTSFVPRFGAASRDAHVAGGAHDLTVVAGASLRRDVDTVDDLREATELGVGPATAAALRRHPLLAPAAP